MFNVLDLTFEQMCGRSFDCKCGKTHTIKTKHIIMQNGAFVEVGEISKQIIPFGKVLLVTSEDVYMPFASKVENNLRKNGFDVLTHIFEKDFTKDMKNTGEIFNYPEDTRLLVSVGGGNVCDVVRYFCSIVDVPYIVVPTTPANDGYLSSKSAIYVNGKRETFLASAPYALICDLDFIFEQPKEAFSAGFGEIVAKLVAVFDWYFAFCVSGEEYCSTLADFVIYNVDRVIAVQEGLVTKDKDAMACLMESLLKISLVEQIMGSTRAIAGAEHHIAHTYDMLVYKAGKDNKLHGEKIFIICKKLLKVYALFLQARFSDIAFPPDDAMRADVLKELLGIDTFQTLSQIQTEANFKQYNGWLYSLDGYRDDLIALVQDVAKKFTKANVAFKKMYDDNCVSLEKHIKASEFKTSMALAPSLTDRFTLLKLMKEIGILDGYLR